MSLIKKLGNYKCKNYSDDIIDNVPDDNEIKIHIYTIKINNLSLNYNIVNHNLLLPALNYDVLTSINIIEQFIILSKELNTKSIKIQDNSFVKINSFKYDLSIYCIILTGYPFYTRYGFISDDHNEELLFNKNIRNLPFNIFMDQTINENKFKRIFPEPCFNNSIKNIMKFINQYLEINNGKLKYNNPIILLLLEIINKGKQLIKYNNKLYKNCL